MKRLICLTLFMCLLLTSCNFSIKKQEKPVPLASFLGHVMPRPDDWEYDFWIGESLSGVDTSDYQRGPGSTFYGSCPSDEPTEFIRYRHKAFISGRYRYTYVDQIEITDPGVKLFGLDINSDPDEWFSLLEQMGYTTKRRNFSDEHWLVSGKKDYFSISITNYHVIKGEFVGQICLYHSIPHVERIIE